MVGFEGNHVSTVGSLLGRDRLPTFESYILLTYVIILQKSTLTIISLLVKVIPT